MDKAFQEFKDSNKVFPKNIVVFRDGVSASQINVIQQQEVPQIQESCRLQGVQARLVYCLVNKRVSAKFFAKDQTHLSNP